MTYSQGPWTKNQWGSVSGHDGESVVYFADKFMTRGQYEANKNLVSAAPEMFEVLEDLDVILGTALHNGHHDLIARVKNVLKKARGQDVEQSSKV